MLLRQTSEESVNVFSLILRLHDLIDGDWNSLQRLDGIDEQEINALADYFAFFLSNVGNYSVGVL